MIGIFFNNINSRLINIDDKLSIRIQIELLDLAMRPMMWRYTSDWIKKSNYDAYC